MILGEGKKKNVPHPTRNKKHPNPLNFRSVMRRQIAFVMDNIHGLNI